MKKPFNLSDDEYQFWKSYILDECIFDLGHLTACKHTFKHPERNESYTLYITFSHHVFTRSPSVEEDYNPDQIYPFPNEDLRLFDEVRYELSHHLPAIIASLPEQFCYHGGYSRYCSCKVVMANGMEVDYQVVYRVWKARGKMRFHVESAYPLKERLGRVKKVSFWVICFNLATGKALPKPAAK